MSADCQSLEKKPRMQHLRRWKDLIECSETYGPEFVRKFFETEAANVD
jgi:hypothetical protein